MSNEPNIVPMCYGCANYNASQQVCMHPNNNSIVQWDSLRNYTYRYPSVIECLRVGGLCNPTCFKPDKERSTLYEKQRE